MRGKIEDAQIGRDCILTIKTADADSVKRVVNEIGKGQFCEIKIDKIKKHRSLDSNAYMWQLLGKIATLLHTDKDSVYRTMLRRYGQFVTIKIPAADIALLENHGDLFDIVDKEFYFNDEECRFMINFLYVNLFLGSSGYGQEEMNAMIEGVVSEAKELGIETLTEEELRRSA